MGTLYAESETVDLAARSKKSQAWFVNPWVDSFLVGGGGGWALIALYFLASKTGDPLYWKTTTLSTGLGVTLIGNPHIAATLVRLYRSPETRKKYWIYSYGLPLALILPLFLGLFYPQWVPPVLKFVLFMNVHHYVAQAYGITLCYFYRAQVRIEPTEKSILKAMFLVSAATLIIRQMTYPGYSVNPIMGQSLPFWGPFPAWCSDILALATFTLAGVFAVHRLIRFFTHHEKFPIGAILVVVTNLFIMCSPIFLSSIVWAYMPTFFHGSQYLLISLGLLSSQDIHMTDGKIPQGWAKERWSWAGKAYLFTILVSALIHVLLPQTIAYQFGFDYNLAVAAMFCYVNIHHYVTDGALWKLREPEIRAYLMN